MCRLGPAKRDPTWLYTFVNDSSPSGLGGLVWYGIRRSPLGQFARSYAMFGNHVQRLRLVCLAKGQHEANGHRVFRHRQRHGLSTRPRFRPAIKRLDKNAVRDTIKLAASHGLRAQDRPSFGVAGRSNKSANSFPGQVRSVTAGVATRVYSIRRDVDGVRDTIPLGSVAS